MSVRESKLCDTMDDGVLCPMPAADTCPVCHADRCSRHMGSGKIKVGVEREHPRNGTLVVLGYMRFVVCEMCMGWHSAREDKLDVTSLQEPVCQLLAGLVTADALETK